MSGVKSKSVTRNNEWKQNVRMKGEQKKCNMDDWDEQTKTDDEAVKKKEIPILDKYRLTNENKSCLSPDKWREKYVAGKKNYQAIRDNLLEVVPLGTMSLIALRTNPTLESFGSSGISSTWDQLYSSTEAVLRSRSSLDTGGRHRATSGIGRARFVLRQIKTEAAVLIIWNVVIGLVPFPTHLAPDVAMRKRS